MPIDYFCIKAKLGIEQVGVGVQGGRRGGGGVLTMDLEEIGKKKFWLKEKFSEIFTVNSPQRVKPQVSAVFKVKRGETGSFLSVGHTLVMELLG